MGLGKLARGLGKVGLLIEGVTYIVAAGKALVGAVRGKKSEQPSDPLPDANEGRDDEQGQFGEV